jgi:hypothetical protein
MILKRPVLILSLAAMLSACSLSLPTEAPTPLPSVVQSPTRTERPSATASLTPTAPTSTFTLTPTLLGGEPTHSESRTPTPTAELVQLVFGSSLTQTSFVDGFVSILLSRSQIYWGECDRPHEFSVTAQVSEGLRVVNVSLFMRLKDKNLDIFSEWDGGTLMTTHHNGTFTHTVQAEDIRNHFNYSNAWVQMQFVSTDGNGFILDRTPIFPQGVGLATCAQN